MPCCSVVICKNSSRNVTYVKDGISFHTFPTGPNLKKKWMDATGRKSDWFPTKNSTICSVHFEPKCFHPTSKIRRLFDWAVPTLRLRLRIEYRTEPSSSKERDYSELKLDIKKEPKEEESDDPLFLPSTANVDSPIETQSEELTEPHDVNETPRKQLRDYILSQKNLIKMQNTKIRTLQKRCSRYQKRIAELKDSLLENKRDIPPIMVSKSQQVNFMYNIPKSMGVSTTEVSAGGTDRREPLVRDTSGKQTDSEKCTHGS